MYSKCCALFIRVAEHLFLSSFHYCLSIIEKNSFNKCVWTRNTRNIRYQHQYTIFGAFKLTLEKYIVVIMAEANCLNTEKKKNMSLMLLKWDNTSTLIILDTWQLWLESLATNHRLCCEIFFIEGELSHDMYGLGGICNLGLRYHLSCVQCPVLPIGGGPDILLTTDSGRCSSYIAPSTVIYPRTLRYKSLGCKS